MFFFSSRRRHTRLQGDWSSDVWSSDLVDLSTVEMRISLGDLAGGRTFRDVLGQQLSFLRFFGLDEDSPIDRVDAAQVFQQIGRASCRKVVKMRKKRQDEENNKKKRNEI